jgi:heme/copper-type cytochrome/quinol oxidase subunit 2
MKLPRIGAWALAVAAPILLAAPAARADDTVTIAVSLRNHQFQPGELHAPANKAITLVVKNTDATPAEFESNMLRVEKVVTGGGTITVRIRPLSPGRYRFFDDFHPETQGYLVVQ